MGYEGGVYGSMLYSVGQRRRELGIRMALGAGRGKVLGMVVATGPKLALVGIALGMAGSLAVTRFLAAWCTASAQPTYPHSRWWQSCSGPWR